jgi:hypothetical protein
LTRRRSGRGDAAPVESGTSAPETTVMVPGSVLKTASKLIP